MQVLHTVRLIGKARRVAEYFGVERKLLQRLSLDEVKEISILSALVENGESSYASPNGTIRFAMGSEGARKLIAMAISEPNGSMGIHSDVYPMPFLGEKLSVPDVWAEFTNLEPLNIEAIQKQLDEGSDHISIEMRGTEKSRFVYRFARDVLPCISQSDGVELDQSHP